MRGNEDGEEKFQLFLEHYNEHFLPGYEQLDEDDKDDLKEEFNKLGIDRLPNLGELLVAGDKDDLQDKFADLDADEVETIMKKCVDMKIISFRPKSR